MAISKVSLQHALSIVGTLALLLLVFELVRRKRLSERYAILWLLAAATLFALAAWKGLLTTLSYDVGISYPPSALFAVAIGLIAMILLNFSLAVSRLSDQNKILAQRLALLQQRLETLTEPTQPTDAQALHANADAVTDVEPDRRRVVAEELSRSR
jgi:hypothetical protein